MSNLNMSILKYAFNLINYKFNKDVFPKKQILEPLSCILNLAILSFKEPGTKIAVSNNRLYIQSPNLFQGPLRLVYGNNREEIHHLLKPLMLATELYPPETGPELKYMYGLAVQGLKHLKQSYNNGSSTVCHTIDLYISVLERKVMEQSVHVDSYDVCKLENLNESQHKIFQDLWDNNDICLVCSLFKSATKSKDISLSYLTSIENIIKAKETIVEEKINKANTLI